MALFDRLARRGMERLNRNISPEKQAKPLGVGTPPIAPTATPNIVNQTQPTAVPQNLTTTPTVQRLNQLPERGELGSTFQGGKVPNRFIADLPTNEQLQGIVNILSGQSSGNDGVDNFVKILSAQGKSPEEIRLAFIQQQKVSSDPFVIL